MTVILSLEVSPRGADAWSRRIGADLLARLQRRHPGATVIHRDLAAEPPPPLDAAFARCAEAAVKEGLRVPPPVRARRTHARMELVIAVASAEGPGL